MRSAQSGSTTDQYFKNPMVASAFGLAYVLISIGMGPSLLIDSIGLFIGFAGGLLVLLLVSMVVIFVREGVATAENKFISGCILLAIGIGIGLNAGTELSADVLIGVVVAIGVIIPMVVLEFSGYVESE